MAKQLSPFPPAVAKAARALAAHCVACGIDLRIVSVNLDHAIPDSLTPLACDNGVNLADSANCQILCNHCNGGEVKGSRAVLWSADEARIATLATWSRAMGINLTIATPAKPIALPDALVNKILSARRGAARQVRCGR